MTRVLIFDSGVGGLSVLKELRAQSCATSYSYVADTAFFPYGLKSDEELINRIPKLLSAARMEEAFDAVVIACNTASTIALGEIRDALTVPVIGTVPAIKPACGLSHSRVVGLLGTPGTVGRPYTDDLIHQFAGDCHVIRYGSSELVDLAERHLCGGDILEAEVARALTGLFDQARGEEIDTIVLACTHFPLLKNELRAASPRPIQWVDSGAAIARQTKSILADRSGDEGGRRADRLYVTSKVGCHDTTRAAFKAYGLKEVSVLEI